MPLIKIKPLSVNEAYQGRRFRTPKHDLFKTAIKYLLPSHYEMPKPPYVIHFEFGVSSPLSDGDNLVKVTQDSIADKYGFNDRLIKRWVIDLELVKKGEEYIKFDLKHLEKEDEVVLSDLIDTQLNKAGYDYTGTPAFDFTEGFVKCYELFKNGSIKI